MPRSVFSLWAGGPLSPIAEASVGSFTRLGHEYTLYAYDPIPAAPARSEVADAAEVLPRKEVRYLLGSGAHALVSDLFRYARLQEDGGIWVDTDIIALRPFDFADDELVFGREEGDQINGAVLGAPPGDPLIEHLHREATARRLRFHWVEPPLSLHESARRVVGMARHGRYYSLAAAPWGVIGPRLLTRIVNKRGLAALARPRATFYPVPYSRIDVLLSDPAGASPLDPGTYAVHLWNKVLADHGVTTPPPGSLLARLCAGGP